MDFSKKIKTELLVPGVILLVWIAVTAFGWVSAVILHSPLAVVRSLPGLLQGGLLSDVWVTLRRVFIALLFAFFCGVPAGLFLGYKQDVYDRLDTTIHAFRSIPATALFPLFLLLTGVGESAVVLLAAYPCFLVILVNAANGVMFCNKRRLYQAGLFELNSIEMVWHVLIYEAMPGVVDGMRTSVSYALALIVAVEMFIGAGDSGIGRRIYEFQSVYRIPETYATIIIAGLLGILLNGLLTLTEKRVLHWHPHVSRKGSGS